MFRRFLSLVVIATAIAIAPQAGLKSRLYVQVEAQASASLRSSDLAGLRLRGIGPATMSGRFVDMDVVESNPYIMYVASATGGMYRTRSEEHTSELQSRLHLVCRLLLEKKKMIFISFFFLSS